MTLETQHPRAVARSPEPSPDDVRVAALGAHSSLAPSFRVRVMNLVDELRTHAVTVEPVPLFTGDEGRVFYEVGLRRRLALVRRAQARALRRIEALDFGIGSVLVQRHADYLPDVRLERAAAGGRRLVWDVDDAIWHDARPEAGGHRLAFLKGTARKVRWLCERADHVIAANEVLASYLRDRVRRVTVVPSLVDPRDVIVRRHADGPRLVLGWIGSHTTAPYLERLPGVLERLARELPERTVRLLVVGGSAPNVRHVEVETTRWTPEAERHALAKVDIGLLPQPDNDWTRGKSAYKAIQYMAAGIPVVADDVGVTESTVGHGNAGLIARSENEWLEALVALARAPDERNALGARGRARVEAHYSLTRWAGTVAAILRGEHEPAAERLTGAGR